MKLEGDYIIVVTTKVSNVPVTDFSLIAKNVCSAYDFK